MKILWLLCVLCIVSESKLSQLSEKFNSTWSLHRMLHASFYYQVLCCYWNKVQSSVMKARNECVYQIWPITSSYFAVDKNNSDCYINNVVILRLNANLYQLSMWDTLISRGRPNWNFIIFNLGFARSSSPLLRISIVHLRHQLEEDNFRGRRKCVG